MIGVNRRHDAQDLSNAAQEYLLALRVMAGDGSQVRAAQVARRLGVSTQAASEMFRRLVADGTTDRCLPAAVVSVGTDEKKPRPGCNLFSARSTRINCTPSTYS